MALFQLASAVGTPRAGIIVQTRMGRNIENEIPSRPSPMKEEGYKKKRRQKFGWELRRTSHLYNCAGLVWASRRTAIYDDDEWDNILKDDGYREVSIDAVKIGDLIIYSYHSKYLHVGLIVATPQGGVGTPRVLSKWNDAATEDFHNMLDVPFNDEGTQIPFEYSFWTDREP